MSANCIFCKIIKGALPASRVYEDKQVIAFMDIMPVNHGHVLVVPKTHFPELSDMDEDTGAHLFRTAMRIEKALRRSGVQCEGTNLLQNNGSAAFQEVMHVHLHIIPRFREDQVRVHLGQRKASRQELEQHALKIKAQLSV